MSVTAPPQPVRGDGEGITSAGSMDGAAVLREQRVDVRVGLSDAEAVRRRARWGRNAVSSHRARVWPVLWHQLRSPLLGLLLAAALASYFVGEGNDAVIIGVIVALSVGLGFINEYRAEKAAEALHDQIRHQAVVVRAAGRRPSTSPSWCPGTWSSCGSVRSCRRTCGCSRSMVWSATSRC